MLLALSALPVVITSYNQFIRNVQVLERYEGKESLADLQTGNRIAVHAPTAGIDWSPGGHNRAARSARRSFLAML